MQSDEFQVYGTVQGVGFRPFIWKLAQRLNLTGEVSNDAKGVLIKAWGQQKNLDDFARAIILEKPPLAIIHQIQRTPLNSTEAPDEFSIKLSQSGPVATGVSADAATCHECLAEVFDKNNRRYGYPFTNCTHCGPRFSITKHIPYDRVNTSMAEFAMCEQCQQEYNNPNNRRFHAQPNACSDCGPQLWLENNRGERLDNLNNQFAIEQAAKLLAEGKVLAIKGLGGFHLACDSSNDQAVSELRLRKKRYSKPLAVMAKNIDQINLYAYTSERTKKLLNSPASPIVLLDKKSVSSYHTNGALAQSIAPKQTQLGVMLPYTALHHWLLEQLEAPIVLTSGNISEEPQSIDNNDARTRLSPLADYFLMHNREIVNRVDDSVVQPGRIEPRIVRRGRGCAPKPIVLPTGFAAIQPTLAMGADLKNTFCLAHNGQAILSQYIGDLEDYATQQDYRQQIELYRRLYQFEPKVIAADKHPNYMSTRVGADLAAQFDCQAITVQHHHAHIAGLMVEAKMALDCEPVLGIALDGLGFGDDGSFWGGEFLLANYTTSQRLARMQPIPMLGGNAAMKEPWRNTLSYLFSSGDFTELTSRFSTTNIINLLKAKPLTTLEKMAKQGVNSPLCSSTGRLFDAVAAALDICQERQDFEGQAANELQALATRHQNSIAEYTLPFDINSHNSLLEINWSTFWPALLDKIANGVEKSQLAYCFHATLCQAISQTTLLLAKSVSFNKVLISGGVAQNTLLIDMLLKQMQSHGFEVVIPKQIPCNDSGIALGQIAVSAALQLKNPT